METTETTVVETELITIELKSVEEVAKEVLNGDWGNGDERKERLIVAGYNYDEVQAKVEELKNEFFASSIRDEDINSNQTYVGEFQGTWYHTWGRASNGGSGRQLIQCNTTETIKGSIASATLYNKYKYKYSGGRTKVYLNFDNVYSADKYGNPIKFMGDKCSCMNGYYYLDDCCQDSWVIDFYYYGENNNCPFKNAGRICKIECQVVN